jgi:hypothetical protein
LCPCGITYPIKTKRKTTADKRLPLLAGDNIPNIATTGKEV